ncbi:MAG TPA: alkaline phosphatase family protein [Xanthobacteraceae bacterium]|nr:alkaline phosphatase family protein [Xanthobacteraceae bacterium]
MSALDQIEHVVVLMLENRSFDCLLGKLYPASAAFDGLTGNESNPDAQGNPVKVWNSPGTDPAAMTIPTPDPGELWVDMNTQLFGVPSVPTPPTPTMAGFVKNYLEQATPGHAFEAKTVMHYFTPDQVPVLTGLARQFAVCDRWFASAPCQTWPNRFFVHTATANGYENNSPLRVPFPYPMTTIFNRFELAGRDWRIYFHDIAQTHTLAKLLPLAEKFQFYKAFRDDARTGRLPAYSFIEPRYFTLVTELPNDMHPPHNVTLGEQLIADVYNSLRSGPAWTKTLLVITYDEHGGCFDHAPPPAAVPPSATATSPFNFDRYGVRVPAVIVSPYIKQGTILRPPGVVPYDHTSVIATLRKRWPDLGEPLTNRDKAAPDLGNALTLATPDNLGPDHIDALPYTPTPAEVAFAQAMPLNGMQHALVNLAANLPNTTRADFRDTVMQHIDRLKVAGPMPIPASVDASHVSAAVDFIKKQTANFFRGV